MKTIEYRTTDKSDWGDGPWQSEPDKMQFVDPDTGFPCLIVRNHSGALCGYVGVPESHKQYGKDWMEQGYSVHGGVTFSDKCQPHAHEEFGVCHLPEPGESDNVWWIGFDCAHAYDLTPASEAELKNFGYEHPFPMDATYRDITYVKEQIASLAKQLTQ